MSINLTKSVEMSHTNGVTSMFLIGVALSPHQNIYR